MARRRIYQSFDHPFQCSRECASPCCYANGPCFTILTLWLFLRLQRNYYSIKKTFYESMTCYQMDRIFKANVCQAKHHIMLHIVLGQQNPQCITS